MAGPKPTPTATLRLRGSWRAKLRPREPVLPPTRSLKAPEWLPPVGRRLFRELSLLLVSTGVATQGDKLALSLLCKAFADFRDADATCRSEGTITTTGLGAKKLHPAVHLRNQAFDQLLKGLALFGLTPADRSRITVSNEPGAETLEELIRSASKSRKHA